MYLSINFKAIVKFLNYQRAIAAPQVAPAPKAVNTIISPVASIMPLFLALANP